MKKLMTIIFFENAVYMILELVASRILSPYFGSSNIIWTSVIGIILLSSSIGNYIGGIIADRNDQKKSIKTMLLISGILTILILILQQSTLNLITDIVLDIKIGAIISTIILFFLPSMFLGCISPIVIKMSLQNIDEAGKTSGKIYAIATLGGIAGTFVGGFYLLPTLGTKSTIILLAITLFILIFLVDELKTKKKIVNIVDIVIIILIILVGIGSTIILKYSNKIKAELVKSGKTNIAVEYDSQYRKIKVVNYKVNNEIVRSLEIDKGNESATYVAEDKQYDLFAEYTKYYDLMFKSSKEIDEVLMIGGAGYSYPKYYISNYTDKKMDVVEIDEKVTELAKEYFYLDKLIDDFDLEENKRLNLINQDGRVYLNKNEKKYDAILNDAFSGTSPVETLTTVEAVESIHNSLTEDGVYLTNIISSIDGINSKFLKAEINTLKQVFKNVYALPCTYKEDTNKIQNIMVIATDNELQIEGTIDLNISDDEIILTDDCCPVDNLIPII